jgi:hypothetical protein
MRISLDEFEQQIDETILKRGLQYFKKGYVTGVDELGGGEYEAVVEGSEDYVVNLSVKNGIVEDAICTCPYDMGPVCKHVAAVLFYLQKDTLDAIHIPVTKKKTGKAQPQSKKKTIEEQVNEILCAVPENELKDFIRSTCKKDKEFRCRFFAKFASVNAPVSKELYAAQIRNLIEAYSDRYGFIEYRETREFGGAVSDILDNAGKDIEKGEYEKALAVIFTVIEEITPVLNSCDDSNGHIGGCIDSAFELMEELLNKKLAEPLREKFFDELVTGYESRKLTGWDWSDNWIHYAIRLLKTPQEKKRIKSILSNIKPSGQDWDWNYQSAQRLMLELITKTENAEAVTQYLKENVSNPNFREELIEQAIKAKDYEQALKLAGNGIIGDDKKHKGLANRWREYQLAVYQKQKDKENIIRIAHYFVMDSSGSQPMKYYYDILKKTVPAGSWQEYLEEMIAVILKKADWNDYNKIASFYIWEGYWERYLALLQKNTTLSRIESAEKYLAGSYSEQLISLYDKEIRPFVENNVGRSYYKDACRYIRRMKKLGGSQIATQLIEALRMQYKSRRALLEELDKV